MPKRKFKSSLSQEVCLNSYAFTFSISGIQFANFDMPQISNVSELLSEIYHKGGFLKFKEIENTRFKNDLILIDSSLPQILAYALIVFYKDGKGNISEISKELTRINPLNYNQSLGHPFYEYKLKRFVSELAMEINPALKFNLTPGLLADNLFKNTFLEKSKSNGCCFIYQENNELLIKLKLKIKFNCPIVRDC